MLVSQRMDERHVGCGCPDFGGGPAQD
jgi:hypothetical protein